RGAGPPRPCGRVGHLRRARAARGGCGARVRPHDSPGGRALSSPALFEVRGLGLRIGETPILRDISFRAGASELIAVAGPNGAGKSTLLGVMAGLREGYTGACAYGGREVREWPRQTYAREAAFVPQSLRLEFPFTAEQVVLMGRTPYCHGLFE